MSCQEFDTDVIDLARGAASLTVSDGAVRQHLLVCRRCAERFEREWRLTAQLRALADATPASARSDEIANALAAAFTAHHAEARRAGRTAFGWPVRFAAAAGIVLAVAGWWAIASLRNESSARQASQAADRNPVAQKAPQPPAPVGGPATSAAVAPETPTPARTTRVQARRPARAIQARQEEEEVAEFLPLPLAAGLPRFESGRIVRVELPVSSLPALGLNIAPDMARRPIEADVLVGQDGEARAIRLVSMESGSRRK
jgi:hypothetical protein